MQPDSGTSGAVDERSRFSANAFAASHAPDTQTIETDLYGERMLLAFPPRPCVLLIVCGELLNMKKTAIRAAIKKAMSTIPMKAINVPRYFLANIIIYGYPLIKIELPILVKARITPIQ